MMEKHFTSGSIILSVLGWVSLVIVSALFLFVGKPYFYTQGYEQGKQDQYAHDVEVVQQSVGGRSPEAPAGIRIPVTAKIVEVKSDSFLIDSSVPNQMNPLARVRLQTVLFDARTKFFSRTQLLPNEYEALLVKARAEGKDPATIPPYLDRPLTAADFKVGDNIQVLARDQSQIGADQYMADEIVYDVFLNKAQAAN